MPWCEPCSRFFTPNALRPDGTCPACGRLVAEPPPPAEAPARPVTAVEDPVVEDPAEEEKVRVPWHFWLLLVAAALYLGWRALEGVIWVVGRF